MSSIYRAWSGISVERRMVLAALALAIASFLFGERVPVNGGFGWDGVLYARWAKDFRQEVFVKGVDTYYIKRILPSAIVHYSMRVLSIPRTDHNILRAFGVLDISLIVLIAWLWGRIARQLVVSERGKWLGFIGLFVNYIVLKYAFYCPVTTDVAGYALGALMLWCYLEGRTNTLIAVLIAGAFTWPTAIYVGALLAVFPRERATDAVTRPVGRRWNLVIASLASAFVLLGIKLVLRRDPVAAAVLVDPVHITPVRSVVNLSIGVAVLYVFVGTAFLLDSERLFALRTLVTCRRIGMGCFVLVLLLTIGRLQSHWAAEPSDWGMKQFAPQTAYAAVARPGVFLVTHATFFGPMFLLALFLWRPVCRLLREHGLGLTLAVGAGLLLSLNSQSRFVLCIWVMLVPFIVKAADQLAWGRRQVGLIAGLGVFASKIWLTFNCSPFTGNLLEFPDQYLFMSHGPWVSGTMYVVQGTALLGATVFVYLVCFARTAASLPHASRWDDRQAA